VFIFGQTFLTILCNTDVVSTWFPKVAAELAKQKDVLDVAFPRTEDEIILPQSIWTSLTLNAGPNTVTKPHRDAGNSSSGLCVVAAFGDYDHTLGGHLVLDDLKEVIEMRNGEVMAFPSALLTHSNTKVRDDQQRRSIVLWTCGQSIRYVDAGHTLISSLGKAEKKVEREKHGRQVSAFLTMDSLIKLG
jgi:hypothetical protein